MPRTAFAGTTNDTGEELFALIVRGQAGEQENPDGKPVTFTETEPVKPLRAPMDTVIALLVVPAGVLTGDWEREIEKSGAAVTVTLSVEELFAAFASPAVATAAVLLILPEAELPTETTSGIVAAELPALIGPGFVHVTACPEALQFHPVALPDTNVNAEARVSVTVIVPVVGPDPTLLTAMLNVPVVPPVKLPVWDLVIERSGGG